MFNMIVKELSMELLNVLLENWDTVGLIITNAIALFVKPPFRKFNDFADLDFKD